MFDGADPHSDSRDLRYASGLFLGSPTRVDHSPIRSGGLITFEYASGDEVANAVPTDPFVLENLVASSWVKDWRAE